MARSRNIKPGFFTDAELVECEFWERLLFAGLWTLADREGRLEDRAKQIKIHLFPADNVDVESGLVTLAEHGLIERYEVAGKRYLHIPNFGKHQAPHIKEAPSTIPAPCEHETYPVQEPDVHGASRPDSGYLIADSLIADTGLLEDEDDAPASPVPLPKYSQVFEVFWREYPTGHGSKVKTYAAWKTHGLDKAGAEDERNAVMAGLRGWKVCERWAVKHMVKAAETWVKERWWDNPPPPADMARASPNGKPPTLTDEAAALRAKVRNLTPDTAIDTTWRTR